MQKITIFGKGGIGKSTLSANLAAVYARQGLRVLLVGCDPKHDTTIALTDGRPIKTVVEQAAFMDSAGGDLSRILVRGRLGIDCVEAGGPEPGIGCAGRGIGRMITILEGAGVLQEGRYDLALFDVLGDVVCGGFAAPLRQGFADKVVIVTSEELMSLYAANNIARAIRNYSDNGVVLCGLVANLRDQGADRGAVERFAARIGTGVLSFFSREAAVREAEYRRLTLTEHAPDCEMSRGISALAARLLGFDRGSASAPAPLSDERFNELSRIAFRPLVDADPANRSKAVAPVKDSPEVSAPKSSVAPPGPDLEKELSWRASLWEGEPGLNSQVWGAKDQWRRFFCDFETRRNVRVSPSGGSSLVNVWHHDLECSYSTPDYEDASLPSFYRFPWPRARAESEDARTSGRESRESAGLGCFMTNLQDRDVIHGGGRRLEEALEQAIENAEGRADAIVVHSTCVPTVIGDDTEAVVKRWQARTEVPIVHVNPAETGGRDLDVRLLLFKKMRQDPHFLKVSRRRRSVNLVGFPPGPARGELSGFLQGLGLSVNACVMPALSLAAARRYLAAEVQIFYPNAAYAGAYKEFFEGLPIRGISPDAPYGFEGTKKWLESVAGEFGLKGKVRSVYGRAAKSLSADWEAGRREASGRSLAFVVDAPHVQRLADPALTWGIPVPRFLREMGFGVEILYYGQLRKESPHWHPFREPGELEALLQMGRFEAVYSEYAYDSRLARAGKAQFSLAAFEMGLAGASRTLGELNGICRWPFQRRYARYMGEA